MTFEDVKRDNLLLYSYIRGSVAYGINTEKSDIDTSGVFLEPRRWLMGLGNDVVDVIADEKNDNTLYSLQKFFKLIAKSNPLVLESLFIPNDKIMFEHELITDLKKHRNEFVTKECFKSFIGYSKEQIYKARGLNKKIVNPIHKRLTPLDFVYTAYKQGSTKISNWLEYRGLKQKYCGLAKIPNMHGVYGMYYDFGSHINNEKIVKDNIESVSPLFSCYCEYKGIVGCDVSSNIESFLNEKPIGYKGIIGEDLMSNELRVSSVEKGVIPLCQVSYNEYGYRKHCKDYREYKTWEKERNEERYRNNISNSDNYDAKNMCHSIRLMHMGIEIAKYGEVYVDRRDIDSEFLIKIKNAEFTYNELIGYLETKNEEMNKAIEQSTIRENVDVEALNDMLIFYRKKYQFV